jgi:hypothetical protein
MLNNAIVINAKTGTRTLVVRIQQEHQTMMLENNAKNDAFRKV